MRLKRAHWELSRNGHTLTSKVVTFSSSFRGIPGRAWSIGPYAIKRRPYGKSAWSYRVLRDGVEIYDGLARLRDAHEFILKNAAGCDVRNYASPQVLED